MLSVRMLLMCLCIAIVTQGSVSYSAESSKSQKAGKQRSQFSIENVLKELSPEQLDNVKRKLKQRQANGHTDVRDLLEALPYKQRAELVNHWVENGFLISAKDVPDLWTILNSARAINSYIDYFKEPLTSKQINGLVKVLHKKHINENDAGEPDVQLRSAALLYRYEHKDGREWLVNHAKRGKQVAALILAQNKAPGTFNDVLKSYKSSILDEPNLRSIVAIASWNNPEVKTLLAKRFIHASLHDLYVQIYAVGLAVTGARRQIPVLQSEFNSRQADFPKQHGTAFSNQQWEAVGLAAALDRLGAADKSTRKCLRLAIGQLNGSSYGEDARTSLQAIGYSNDKTLLPELTKLLQSLAHKKAQQIPDDLINDVLTTIVRLDGKIPAKLLPKLLHVVWNVESDRQLRQFKAVLIASGTSDALEFLKHPTGIQGKWNIDQVRISDKQIQRIEKLRKMRWVPDDLLPESSRGWDVLWGWKRK